MPSFDIVSEVDLQEVENAINQVQKEIKGRYDFKGSKTEVEWNKKEIELVADDEYKIGVVKDMLQSKVHRRGVDILALNFEDVRQVGGQMLRQKVTLVQGIEKEAAKSICKQIRDSKIKVQAQVSDEKIKVSSKSIDALQECIAHVKGLSLNLPVQFENMRS
ncbi:YajQ family cyclic di-GMP-binding protein [Bdellovibrionales bacterium]|nr:YajQ family cyclic di-GMP-binding protein [Bdellovibrionales bacterium]